MMGLLLQTLPLSLFLLLGYFDREGVSTSSKNGSTKFETERSPSDN